MSIMQWWTNCLLWCSGEQTAFHDWLLGRVTHYIGLCHTLCACSYLHLVEDLFFLRRSPSSYSSLLSFLHLLWSLFYSSSMPQISLISPIRFSNTFFGFVSTIVFCRNIEIQRIWKILIVTWQIIFNQCYKYGHINISSNNISSVLQIRACQY